MAPSKIKQVFMGLDAMFTAPHASMKLNMRGLYPYEASWQTNPAVGQRTILIWSLKHCSGKSYMEQYLEGRANGGTH